MSYWLCIELLVTYRSPSSKNKLRTIWPHPLIHTISIKLNLTPRLGW